MKFYKGITPNTEFSENFIGSKKAFIDYLNAFKFYEVASNQQNYVIYDTIRIKNVSPIREAAFEISYIYDELTNYFYHVRSCTILKDAIIFNVSRDTWANEVMEHAKDIKHLQVLKSNKKVGVGFYDEIKTTDLVTRYEPLKPTMIDEDYCIIITAVKDNPIKQSLSAKVVPVLETYVLTYQTILSAYNQDDTLQRGTPFEYSLWMISTIREWLTGTEGQGNRENAQFNVIKAYLCDKNLIKYTENKTEVYYYQKLGFQKKCFLYKLIPSTNFINFDIPIDPNYNYYVGSKYNNLKLLRTNIGYNKITFECITKQDGLEIKIKQGENQLDITNAFEITFTTIEGVLTAQQKLSHGINALSGIISSTKNVMKGEVLDGATSFGRTLIPFAYGGSNGSYIHGGDGITSFSNNRSINSPYYVVKYSSTDNEKKNAAYNGINYDIFIEDLTTLLQFDNIDELIDYPDVKIIIQCKVNQLNGFTLDTQNVIRSRFMQGIEIHQLNG